jgi:hypothetical protein
MSLFEISDEGFKQENRGREPWELVRELIQNALDTESDVVIKLDTRSRKVIVQNAEDTFDNLEDAYTVFGGDKGDDPTKRGRYGRGLKEAVAGVDRLVVMTTHGRVTFNVTENQRVEDDRTIESGTKIIAENSEWDKDDFDAIKDYIFKLWPPQGQKLVLSLKGGKTTNRARWDPDMTANMRLKTVRYENGQKNYPRRNTSVHIHQAEPNEDGRIYEMGIPVNLNEDFPFYVDIQQKIPMAEQRNEANSSWVSRFKTKLLNKTYTELTEGQLRHQWVMDALDTYLCDNSVKKHVANTVLKDDQPRVVSGSKRANDVCRNHGYSILDPQQYSSGLASAAKHTFPSALEKARNLKDNRQEKVDPTDDEQAFIDQAHAIAQELDYTTIDIEMWEIDPDLENGSVTNAAYEDGVVKLNRLSGINWTEINQNTLGTLVHELSHHGTRGHSEDWYTTMQSNFATLLAQRW